MASTDDSPRIVFAGTPDFAATSLRALLDAGHKVAAVLTQPDRPAGRGRRPRPSAVKALAGEWNLPVLQPERLGTREARESLRELAPEVMVVVAYGLLIPPKVLEIPRHGCINVHGSLLPRWRGAAPIQRALAAGDRETGISIMRMEAGLDTGPVLHRATTPIHPDDTAASLHDRLAELGARTLLEVLRDLSGHLARAEPQPDEGVTYARKIEREESRLDWTRPAEELERLVRAFHPFPGAWSQLDGQTLKIHQARVIPGSGRPGEIRAVQAQGVDVATGDGCLRLVRLQLPGKRDMPVDELLRGHGELFSPGRCFVTGCDHD